MNIFLRFKSDLDMLSFIENDIASWNKVLEDDFTFIEILDINKLYTPIREGSLYLINDYKYRNILIPYIKQEDYIIIKLKNIEILNHYSEIYGIKEIIVYPDNSDFVIHFI